MAVSEDHPRSGPSDPMPEHWENTYGGFVGLIFKFLCIIGFGHASLKSKWDAVYGGDRQRFAEEEDRLANMVGNHVLVASILIASIAPLMTTSRPDAGIVDYTLHSAQISIWTSLGVMFGGIIVGGAIQIAIWSNTLESKQTRTMETRWKVWAAIVVLAYPCLCIGASAIVYILGLLLAAWRSQNNFVRIAGGFQLLAPAMIMVLFILVCCDFGSEAEPDPESLKPRAL